ncbi:MAG: amidohydrolase family protein [Pirellulaceae bacterium]|jgi:imidazolonepropionase-like amidohydrolase|nr:amidohydrolase family protein [Pirellulaceae bacterium]
MTRIVITFLITLFCSGSVALANDVLLKATKAITLDGPPIEPAAILVHDGKIKQIAQTIDVAGDVKVVDLGEAVVVPGFVNAYSQLGITGGSSELTREITPDFDVQSAIDWESRGFRETLDAGVTTVGISPGTDNVVAGISLAVKTAGDDVDQRVVKHDTGLVITLASDPRSRNRARSRPDSIYVRQPTNRMGVVWMLRSTLQGVEGKADSAGVLAEALSGKRRIYCVSRTHFDIETVLRVAEEFDFSPVIVGGEESYQLASLLAEKKLPVILGPLRTTLSAGAEGTEPAWNRAGVLHQAGVVIAMSGPDLLEQARFAVRFGLPEDSALRAITIEPAKLLGIEDRVGSLAVGRDANLVVLSGDPFEFTTDVQAVIVDGTLIDEEDKEE